VQLPNNLTRSTRPDHEDIVPAGRIRISEAVSVGTPADILIGASGTERRGRSEPAGRPLVAAPETEIAILRDDAAIQGALVCSPWDDCPPVGVSIYPESYRQPEWVYMKKLQRTVIDLRRARKGVIYRPFKKYSITFFITKFSLD
jgi:hypothetical protein